MSIHTSDDPFIANCFVKTEIETRRVNIDHKDVHGRGPFCRLHVSAAVPTSPGVYVWCVDDEVKYVGKAGELRQIVQGARMGRAYNDYTYIPKSSLAQASSPRVRINGLLNRAVCGGSTISWWWRETDSAENASLLEAQLISDWQPPWNRAMPTPSLGCDVTDTLPEDGEVT